MTHSPPSPSEQVAFLRRLQRILDEGSFTATYKYALLHAIADLCVTVGDDTGAPLVLSSRAIAERFVELYWRQVALFPSGEDTGVLAQDTRGEAAIVREVREARASYGESVERLKTRGAQWEALVRRVDATIRRYPLQLLQTVGQEQVEFLYENRGTGRSVTLLPGVAYCFRAFYPMITDMVEGAWSHFVRRYNGDLLGHATDLRAFLFGSDRSSAGRLPPAPRGPAGRPLPLLPGAPGTQRRRGPLHPLAPLPHRPGPQLRPGPRPL